MKRKQIISLTIMVFAVVVLVLGSGSVYAAENTSSTNPFSQLIETIIQKFGLDRNQVKTVVEQYRAEKRENQQTKMQDMETKRLDKLVSEGKITADQKTAILNELKAVLEKYQPEADTKQTPQERKDAMQKMRDELTAWAKSKNIDPSYVFPGFGPGMGRGWRGNWKNVTPTP